MHLYRRRGWQVLAPRFRFMPGPTYRILGRRLAPITPAEAARCQIRPATFTDVEAIRAIAWATWTETYRGLMAPKTQGTILERWYSPRPSRPRWARGTRSFWWPRRRARRAASSR